MQIRDIVEAFNQHIRDKRESLKIASESFVMHHIGTNQDIQFKAYKTYEINIWYINNHNGVRKRLVSVSNRNRAVTQTELDNLKDTTETTACRMLFNLIGTETYDKLINDTLEDEAI